VKFTQYNRENVSNVINAMSMIVNFNGFEATIAYFQWFLRRASPLNVFWQSEHCHQWFFNGF